IHSVCRTIGERCALAVIVDRDRGLVPVLHGPDDVFGAPRGVTAEEPSGMRRLHRLLVDDRHSVRIEVDADIAFDPGEGILLPDGEDDVVAQEHNRIDYLALLFAAFLAPAESLELEPDEPAILEHEALGRMVLDDLDAFLFRVL